MPLPVDWVSESKLAGRADANRTDWDKDISLLHPLEASRVEMRIIRTGYNPCI